VTMKNGVFWVLTRATRRNNPEDTILHYGDTVIVHPLYHSSEPTQLHAFPPR
jgi:hypothetical protein